MLDIKKTVQVFEQAQCLMNQAENALAAELDRLALELEKMTPDERRRVSELIGQAPSNLIGLTRKLQERFENSNPKDLVAAVKNACREINERLGASHDDMAYLVLSEEEIAVFIRHFQIYIRQALTRSSLQASNQHRILVKIAEELCG